MSRSFTPDVRRDERLGFDEAIFADGKSAEHLEAIIAEATERGAGLLLTKMRSDQFAALASTTRDLLDYDPLSTTAIMGPTKPLENTPRVAVVTAGTSDLFVSRETVRTLNYYGHACVEVTDVGVAGLWRLLERLDEIRPLPIVITVAGMDAALPSVVAGQVPGAVIAVPTSTGYGVANRGETALRAVLVSCAPGVLVVNIDNGYGAACAALRMLNVLDAERRLDA